MAMFASLYRQVAALDLDEIFSYQTTKEVRMLDRRLGMVCWVIRAIVMVYVVGYVFVLREGYTETEKSVGHVVTSVTGTTHSTTSGVTRPWDAIDVAQPAIENAAAFIASTVYVTKGQTISNHSNPLRPCTTGKAGECPNDPPLSYGVCASGFCQEYGWAPAFAETDQANTIKHELVGGDKLGLWMRASISFPSLDESRTFSTIGADKRTPYAGGAGVPAAKETIKATIGDGKALAPDYYTVGELLQLAGTSYDTVRLTGCTLGVTFYWECFVDSTALCAPKIQVQRLDLNERRRGFSYQYADYYRPVAGAADTRDLNTVFGVRLLISSLGKGKKVSLAAIMLQISSGIALLWLAGAAADFLMLYILPEKRHYRTYKQEHTPDFSDLRNKIAEVEGEKKKLRDRKNRFAAKLDES